MRLLSCLGILSGPALRSAEAPPAETAETRPALESPPQAAPTAAEPETPPQVMRPFIVRGAPYVAPMLPPILGPMGAGITIRMEMPAPSNLSFDWLMEGDTLLSFTHAPMPRDHAPFASGALDAAYLGRFPFETTAALLDRQSAYPRNGYVSNGPAALVLRDGVPLNHAFDGMVNWRKVSRESLGKIELLPAGAAAAWGEARGVVHLFSAPPRVQRTATTRGTATAADVKSAGMGTMLLTAGTGERSFEQWLAVPVGEGALQLGVAATEAEERLLGQPDETEARSAQLTARWQTYLTPNSQIRLSGRYFSEKRTQPGAPRRERELSGTASLSTKIGALLWQATLFAQSQPVERGTDFSSTVPRAPLDVTPTTFGGDAVMLAGRGEANSTAVGASYRTTRAIVEDPATGGRSRFARTTGGGHAIRQYALTGAWRVNYGARWDLTEDHVNMTGGERRDRDARVSPLAGVTWHGGKAWVARLGTQRGYQRPTLNELYETERGARITPEISRWHTEFGIEWRAFAAPPAPEVVKLGQFAINLPRAAHQRMSAGLRIFTDRTREFAQARAPETGWRETVGGEARIAWTPVGVWRAELAYLHEESALVASLGLIGKPSRQQALATVEFPIGKLRGLLVAGWRDEPVAANRHEESLLLRLGVSYPWSERTLVFGSVETNDGSRTLVTLARAPRESARVGVRRAW